MPVVPGVVFDTALADVIERFTRQGSTNAPVHAAGGEIVSCTGKSFDGSAHGIDVVAAVGVTSAAEQ